MTKSARLYKVLASGRSPMASNRMKWSLPKLVGKTWKPGRWHSVEGELVRCRNGLHLTDSPPQRAHEKNDPEIYEVEVEGELQGPFGDEWVARKVRLVRRLSKKAMLELGVRVPSSEKTPARRFMQVLWDGCFEKSQHSWLKMNHCLHKALATAIEAGMKFAEGDVAGINNTMRGSYWLHAEQLYTLAVEKGNTSACISIEHYFGRRAWIWKGQRLRVGSETPWGKVTSIGAEMFIACTYKTKVGGIERRNRVTEADFDAAASEERRAARAAREETITCGHCHRVSKLRERGRVREWCRCGERYQHATRAA